VAEELRRLGLTEKDLIARRKSDAAKLAIAVRLHKETTLTVKAIGARACLGTSKSANARLHRRVGTARRAEPRQPQLRLSRESDHAMGDPL